MRLLASRGAFTVQRMVAASCQLSLLKIICLHLTLYASVVGYLALGGFAFMWIEGGAENADSDDFISHLTRNWSAIQTAYRADRQEDVLFYLRDFLSELKTRRISVDTFLRATEQGRWNASLESASRRWTMANSVLYAFTLLTTIGFLFFFNAMFFGYVDDLLSLLHSFNDLLPFQSQPLPSHID